MTAALLSAALGLLVWPATTAPRTRLGSVAPGSPAARRWPSCAGAPPRPLLAGCLAGAGAALLSTPLVAALAAGVATLGAVGWQRRRRAQQEDAQLEGLLEGLGALTAELRSGRSLEAATDAAVSACPGKAAGALALAVRAPRSATAAGPELKGAAQPGSAALDRISAAVVLSARTGCSLAAVLSALEEDLRARRRAQAELRAAVAGPQASAVLLSCLPALGLAMGSGVGADPWRVLTATGTGQLLLVAGVALEVAGVAWSGRLVRLAIR